MNANQAVPGSAPLQSRRPFPQFGDILLSFNGASSNYAALQVTFQKNLSNGWSLWSSYEHANGFDDATSDGDAGVDRRNLTLEYGPATYLVRNRFRSSSVYELPFGKGKRLLASAPSVVEKMVGGWRVMALATFQGGTPLTVTGPSANTGGFVLSRANRLCNGNLPKSERTIARYFNTSCFAAPPANTIGTSGRGVLTGPGLNNWDLSLAKDTRIAESKVIRFQAQFFNAFNHAQFNAPVTDVNSPLFGRIISSLKGRSIQFGIELSF